MAPEPPVVSPATLSEALALRAEGGWRPLAGGTDLMVQLEADRLGITVSDEAVARAEKYLDKVAEMLPATVAAAKAEGDGAPAPA